MGQRRDFFFQIGSGAHPASYEMGTGAPFPRGKAGGTRTSPLRCT